MSQFLIRQAAKAIAGSAAPQMAAQIAQRLTSSVGPATSDEDRRRFLIWLAGPFKQALPDAHEIIWQRVRGNDDVIDALTAVFLELQSAGPGVALTWFGQLAESDQQHFDELIAAMAPQRPNPQEIVKQASRDAESTLRGAARKLGQTYRRTSREARKRKR